LKFFLDFPKMKDQRWEVKDAKPLELLAPGIVFQADFPSGNPTDLTPSMKVVIQRWPYYTVEADNKRHAGSMEFKSWGKTVKVDEWQELCLGFYKEWLATATDPVKDKCKEPDKKGAVGPAGVGGYAVAIDKDSKKRERHDFFTWVTTDPPV